MPATTGICHHFQTSLVPCTGLSSVSEVTGGHSGAVQVIFPSTCKLKVNPLSRYRRLPWHQPWQPLTRTWLLPQWQEKAAMQRRNRKHCKTLTIRSMEKSGCRRHRLQGRSFAALLWVTHWKEKGEMLWKGTLQRPCKPLTELCPLLSRNTHEHKKKQGRQHKLDKPAPRRW